MRLIIKEGYIVDPVNNLIGEADILIEEGIIKKINKKIEENVDNIISAKDRIVMPALIDLHVHLREPGREDKETILTGTEAASKGGITTILVMPNTDPAIDSPEAVRLLKERIKRTARIDVLIASTITLRREGKVLVDFEALKKEGVVAITDDGSSVDDENLLLKAMQEAKEKDLLLLLHCEDKSLSSKGMVNLGVISTRLGLRGIPKEAEYRRVERDIKLSKKINAPIHITHVSCKESVDLIAKAKKEGIRVTCDTAPHYFSLTEEELLNFDTNKKVNPPLRKKEDLLAIKEALKEGIIDCIASDHAPHTEHEKEVEFENAEFGTIGLETELAVAITYLVEPGLIDWCKLVELFCINPSKILKIDKGTLAIGKPAELIILDPSKEWVVKKDDFLSLSKNSAFLGMRLKGKVEYTIYKGKIIYPF
ncbi:MAG: dihydroorotase [Candidatus Omnitrophica bacterium]|nr:dihydroorotase [Candidatus Omnitrophota bacterium]MCM8799135.1 dihydroorotase [Candidatus Omnitrophota bacterium]